MSRERTCCLCTPDSQASEFPPPVPIPRPWAPLQGHPSPPLSDRLVLPRLRLRGPPPTLSSEQAGPPSAGDSLTASSRAASSSPPPVPPPHLWVRGLPPTLMLCPPTFPPEPPPSPGTRSAGGRRGGGHRAGALPAPAPSSTRAPSESLGNKEQRGRTMSAGGGRGAAFQPPRPAPTSFLLLHPRGHSPPCSPGSPQRAAVTPLPPLVPRALLSLLGPAGWPG